MRRPRLPGGSAAGRSTGRVGHASAASPMPAGLVQGDRIDPIFTPATKAEEGPRPERPVRSHGRGDSGPDLADRPETAEPRPLRESGRARLIGPGPDPGRHQVRVRPRPRDSGEYASSSTRPSRPTARGTGTASTYRPGGPQPSFDKQFVRDWLDASGWDKASPPPALPDDVVARTRAKYIEAFETLTGRQPSPGPDPPCSAI